MKNSRHNINLTKDIDQAKTAKRIIELREEKGISQNKIAKELGVSRTYYNELENGKRGFTKQYLQKLAEYYGVDISLIVEYKKDYNAGYADCMEELFSPWFYGLYYSLFSLQYDIPF